MPLAPAFRLPFLAALLGFSGAAALIYQMAWLRELRLIFGGATPATAAVLAIFMGGLGVGSAWLGRRAESSPRPLRLYAGIELGVGGAALLTPLLLIAVRTLYIQTGGIVSLGLVPATLLQLLLATVVLALPCLLMGGSLPVACKWVETDQDRQRGALGVLYGINTLGALLGVLASTFWMLEHWGNQATVFAAAAINLGIGALAWLAAAGETEPAAESQQPAPKAVVEPAAVAGSRERRSPRRSPPGATRGLAPPSEALAAPPRPGSMAKAPPPFIYAAAAGAGFLFFLAELVWFRMLAPLLGSSVYGFGLILALALAGIGLGGLAYRWIWATRPGWVSLTALAGVAGVQALLLALPWALGDRLAVVAIALNELRAFGLPGQVLAWSMLAGVLAFGPSLLAGVQFPLLVGLLGEGREDAGRHVGYAYAANTLGAIGGSLTGGFVLLPWLTAPGCWRLAAGLALLLGGGAGLLAQWQAPRRTAWGTLSALAGAVLWLLLVPLGPTAAWRHQPIGYGRATPPPPTVNGLRDWLNTGRQLVAAEFEGREVSVAAVVGNHGDALHVNGKSDGSAFGDADTQVMLGLLPAMLHPAPTQTLVVGLGTGSSAGWLAAVPGMRQVDVVELEPAMPGLAQTRFLPVNHGGLNQPKLRLIIGDAREVLLTRGPRYDLIVSEPSNPYRAGVANLFTREYYQAVQARLAPGGLFGQWLQGYEVDSAAVRLVYATLAAVFPYVETWITSPADLLFIGHSSPPSYSLEQLRSRLEQAPFGEAVERVWFTSSAEGILAHHIGNPALVRRIVPSTAPLNTDDRNRLEYGFARALSRGSSFDTAQLLALARGIRADLPEQLETSLDRSRIEYERVLMLAANRIRFTVPEALHGEGRARAEAVAAFVEQRYPAVLGGWVGEPRSPMERLLLLESVARAGSEEELRPLLAATVERWPADARFAAALAAARRGAPEAAVEHLVEGFAALRQQVWIRPEVIEAALGMVGPLATERGSGAAVRLFEALARPFPAGNAEIWRMNALTALGPQLPPGRRHEVAALFEPHPPWLREFLEFRLAAYREILDPRAAAAEADLREFLSNADPGLDRASSEP